VAARQVMSVGLALFGVSCLVMGLAPAFWVLLPGRVLQGVGAGLLFGGGLQAAVRVHDVRERAIGAFNSSFLLGGALGAPVGGWVAALVAGTAGFRVAFVVCCVVCLVAALVAVLRLPELGPAVVAGPVEVGWPRFGPTPGLGLALVLGSIGDFVRGGVVYTALPLVGAQRSFSTATIGLAVGVLSGVEILALSRSEPVLRRFGAVRCILVALALGVVASVLVGTTTGWAAFLAGSVLFGVAVAGATVGPPLVIVALAGDAAVGLAQFRIASGVGMTVGSTGAAVVAGALGATRLFALIGAFLVGAIVVAHTVGRRQPQLFTRDVRPAPAPVGD
jgi:predicted MFS family arabinose efflux permease